MKLATRLAAATSAVFAVVLLVASVFLAIQDIRFTDDEIDLHGRLLGRVVALAVEETRQRRGDAEARELLRQIDEHEDRISVSWIDLEAAPGEPDYSPRLGPEARELLARGEVLGRINPKDEPTFYTYVPLSPGESTRVIRIAESLDRRTAHVRSELTSMALVAGLGALLSSGAAFFLGRRLVGGPVKELVGQARRIGAGDLEAPAPETMHHELGALAREMNAMARNLAAARDRAEAQDQARREMEARLQHADKLATAGRLAAGVAHEIATPLQSIAVRAELISTRAGHIEGIPEWVDGILGQTRRIGGISSNLLRFSRKGSSRRAPADLREVVRGALALVRALPAVRSIELRERLPAESATAEIDVEQLTQVVTNLLVNAVQAMPQGGTILVGVTRGPVHPPAETELEKGEYWCLFVEDDGPGIEEEVMDHLFEPFFTTKSPGEGTGLGLSIAYGIAQQHGGWIDVKTEVGRGTRFSLYVPPRLSRA